MKEIFKKKYIDRVHYGWGSEFSSICWCYSLCDAALVKISWWISLENTCIFNHPEWRQDHCIVQTHLHEQLFDQPISWACFLTSSFMWTTSYICVLLALKFIIQNKLLTQDALSLSLCFSAVLIWSRVLNLTPPKWFCVWKRGWFDAWVDIAGTAQTSRAR